MEDTSPVQWVGTQALVTLPARVDVSNAGQIGEELLSVISRGAAVLVVDMTATAACDHAGADAVARAYQQAAVHGTQLRLVVTAPAVRRVLGFSGLEGLVPVYPSRTAAGVPAADAEAPAGRQQHGQELLDKIARSLSSAGLSLQAALSEPGAVAREHITAALQSLDDTIREIRDHVFTTHAQTRHPPAPPEDGR
ncbi:MAG: STAS domain-containing protein [Micromonosporaceae bacterium]